MKIIVVNETTFKIATKPMQILADRVILSLQKKRLRSSKKLMLREITLVFLSGQQMRQLNYKFRQKNRPTDVLSFQPIESGSIGELVFCPEVLAKQSAQNKHSLSFEWLYMFIHGLLHLCDYDHEKNPKEEKLMFKIQDQIFERLTENPQALKYICLKKG